MSGMLYLVPTPIGNLGDISPRMAEALAQADLVFLCMHPRGIQEFLSEHRDHFRPGSWSLMYAA